MLVPLLALAAAAISVEPGDLSGIWQGAVGNLPVQACFVRRESGWFGDYYYVSRGALIPLEAAAGSSATFREGGGTGRRRALWRIEHADESQLTAHWTGGGRTLPVRLTRLARAQGEEGACSSPLFHRPRLAGVRTVTARGTMDGVSFTRITLDFGGRFEAGFATFALDDGSEAARLINATLGRGLAGDPPGWFECIRMSLEQWPNEGSFDEILEPLLISRRWLSVRHHWDGFCGGAHPDSSNVYRTFDLASGREIDLHDWLNTSAVQRERPGGEEIRMLGPALRDAILAGWSHPVDCDEIVRNEEFWTIGLTREGLVFSPDLPHAAQACGDEFRLPMARLRPFLTEEGAENLRALQEERAAAPNRSTP
jgi:hypothetical protein